MQKISPFLWFDNQAEEAAEFYVSVFENSRILSVSRYPEGSPGEAGTVMTARIVLDGEEFTLLNGGPIFEFNPSVSFVVNCATQAEVDRLWDALTADGGEAGQCGWLTDRFGLSWQIVPEGMYALFSGDDPAAIARANTAMLSMIKLDLAEMQRAYDGV